jgi:dTMP kinase
LAAALAARGIDVVATREPGGTPLGEHVRDVLLHSVAPDPRAEALLFCAARAQLVSDVVRPALDRGAVVLCDRFYDATLAYQGYGAGLGHAELAEVIRFATEGLVPDLTLLLDVPVAAGLARRRDDGTWNRLDAADHAYHERVRAGYLALTRDAPDRWRVIDASASLDEVASAVWEAVRPLLHERSVPAL